MDTGNTLSEEECTWYMRHLESSLETYSSQPRDSYLHVCAANVLLGFVREVLPKASPAWQEGYLNTMGNKAPNIRGDMLILDDISNGLENEVAKSGFCFKPDERD